MGDAARQGGMPIGVVVPAFNAARFIADALGSLRAQTHADWRAVVVDDGSTDATAAVVEAVDEPRLSLIRQANAGVAVARNRGAATLPAEALLFLDADDWLAPDALSRLSAGLAREPAAVACCGPHAFVAPGPRRDRVRIARGGGKVPSGQLLDRLLVGNLFTSGGHVLVRRTAFEATGGYRPGLAFGEDFLLWVQLAQRGPFASVAGSAPVLFVRRPPDGAFRRMAHDPAAIRQCLDAIFADPGVKTHVGAGLAAARVRAEAEYRWIAGRELLRRRRRAAGCRELRHSLAAAPGLKRLVLTACAHVWPGLIEPFRPYAD
jgi:glycosyltransferase involved in cell wall biosynthesis